MENSGREGEVEGRIPRGGLGFWERIWGHRGVRLASRGVGVAWEWIWGTWKSLGVLGGDLENTEGLGGSWNRIGGTEAFGQR